MYSEAVVPVPINFITCKACNKVYNKLGSHQTCYKRYCWICDIIFDTATQQQKHSVKNHPNFYCSLCKENIMNIDAHKKNKKYCIP